MKLTIAYVSTRSQAKSAELDAAARVYVARSAKMAAVDLAGYESEKALLGAAERAPGRAAARVLLFDSRGESLTSEAFAGLLGGWRDEGVTRVLGCVGGADGWSEEARGKAQRLVSLGRMTLPHELARVVVCEQVYRALTILAGHPYHCGH